MEYEVNQEASYKADLLKSETRIKHLTEKNEELQQSIEELRGQYCLDELEVINYKKLLTPEYDRVRWRAWMYLSFKQYSSSSMLRSRIEFSTTNGTHNSSSNGADMKIIRSEMKVSHFLLCNTQYDEHLHVSARSWPTRVTGRGTGPAAARTRAGRSPGPRQSRRWRPRGWPPQLRRPPQCSSSRPKLLAAPGKNSSGHFSGYLV